MRIINRQTCDNVTRALGEASKLLDDDRIILATQAGVIGCQHWHKPKTARWHLIMDEAPNLWWHRELRLEDHYDELFDLIDYTPVGVNYALVEPKDVARLERVASCEADDEMNDLLADPAARILDPDWQVYVSTEQIERIKNGKRNARLSMCGVLDTHVFERFETVTFLGANLEQSVAYRLLTQQGVTFKPHTGIMVHLTQDRFPGSQVEVIYCTEDRWSKQRRDTSVKMNDGRTLTIGEAIIEAAMQEVGEESFVYLQNKDKDIEDDDNSSLANRGVKLPHSSHGLNDFGDINNGVVIPALLPMPVVFGFFDDICHLNSDEVVASICHEQVHQALGRLIRDMKSPDHKKLICADRAAADYVAACYPGAIIRAATQLFQLADAPQRGRPKLYASHAEQMAEFRSKHKAELCRQLRSVNGGCDENIYLSNEFVTPQSGAQLGGSFIPNIYSRPRMNSEGAIAAADFMDWIAQLHGRRCAKHEAALWSPAEFVDKPDVETHRGNANITRMWGIWIDAENGDLMPDELAEMFPQWQMVAYNSASSTISDPRYRSVIPTTAALTPDVHREIMRQIEKSLNKRGYYSKKQLAKRAERGLGGKAHGFDISKFTPCSMFYLPAQAVAGDEHSFFLRYEGGARKPIDPWHYVQHSILDHRPEPRPPEPVSKSVPVQSAPTSDERLRRARQEMA